MQGVRSRLRRTASRSSSPASPPSATTRIAATCTPPPDAPGALRRGAPGLGDFACHATLGHRVLPLARTSVLTRYKRTYALSPCLPLRLPPQAAAAAALQHLRTRSGPVPRGCGGLLGRPRPAPLLLPALPAAPRRPPVGETHPARIHGCPLGLVRLVLWGRRCGLPAQRRRRSAGWHVANTRVCGCVRSAPPTLCVSGASLSSFPATTC